MTTTKKTVLRDEILEFLITDQQGHVDGTDRDYGATQIVRERFPGKSASTISEALRQLEDADLIWSDWRHPRCRDHIYVTRLWERKLSPHERVDLATREASDEIINLVSKLTQEVFAQGKDEVWVEEASRLEDEVTRLRELNIEQADRLEEAKETIVEMAETIRRLENDVRTVKGSFQAYKNSVKASAKQSVSAQRAERSLNEAIARINRAHKNLSFTHHATKRMREMKLGEPDILRVISNPDIVHDSRHNGESNLAYKKGDLTVIVSRDNGAVITVLWNRVEQWTREEFVERNA